MSTTHQAFLGGGVQAAGLLLAPHLEDLLWQKGALLQPGDCLGHIGAARQEAERLFQERNPGIESLEWNRCIEDPTKMKSAGKSLTPTCWLLPDCAGSLWTGDISGVIARLSVTLPFSFAMRLPT